MWKISNMATFRGMHAFSRKACKIFDFKPNGNVLKSRSQLAQILGSSVRANGSVSIVSVSPKTRQLLNTINRSNKWNTSLFENITRSSSSVVCLLSNGNTSLLATLCSALDELSTEGDEDSTNRKKRIYLAGRLNDDP
ncbi:Hypothetical predicted protein [Paramuricea clavata]|uniref:Uncharacterized protein n=1 Tax=Paramuricea clavata TaxID=317549 RepID=A0A7D9EQH2_PARCT|nr:Hypothetical predicted protein [Paramuricea clavata]